MQVELELSECNERSVIKPLALFPFLYRIVRSRARGKFSEVFAQWGKYLRGPP